MTRARTFTAATATASRLFPFVAGAGSPQVGVPIGEHIMWGETVHLDPFEWLTHGITTNTGMFQLGQPGTGKSAFAKRQILGIAAAGGRPVVLGDPKGEYTSLVQALGGQVIRVGYGLDRINPLDSASLAGMSQEQIRAARLAFLLALCGQVRRRRPISNGEEVILAAAVDSLSERGPDPTLPDVLAAVRTPEPRLLAAAQVRGAEQYDDVTRELRWTLGLLVEGPLAGVFDGPSSRSFDRTAPAIAIDLSAVDDEALLGAAMVSAWAWGQAAVTAAAATAPGTRWLLVMDELWRALRGAPGIVDHVDALTRLNRSRGVASLMITHSLNDLQALPDPADVAKAMGFIDRSAVVVLSGLPRRELDAVAQVVPLTSAEKELVSGWASADRWRTGRRHPGRGKYLIKTGHRPGLPVAMHLTGREQDLFNTDPGSAALGQLPGHTLLR